MERIAFELVDSGIVSVSSRGKISDRSPGLAIADGDRLDLGIDAASNARLKPRRLHSRFWQQLGTANLGRPYPAHLRTADLAHAHLSSLWHDSGLSADEVIVAVPGLLSREQLGLFLGIASSCKMPVRGLVDLAVAAAADRATRPRCIHLDLHLHRVVLTVLEHGDEIVRREVVEDSGVGLVDLYDRWARAIANQFVRITRFDPLHQAATEQILYIQLHTHLEALARRTTAEVSISSGGRRHTIELERSSLVAAASHAYETILSMVTRHSDGGSATLLVSDRAAALPEIAERLEDAGDFEVLTLHPAAAGSAALSHADKILSTDRALPLITKLPGHDAKKPAPMTVTVANTPTRQDVPTHVVIDGVAHRLTDRDLALSVSQGDSHRVEPEDLPRVRLEHGKAVIEAPSAATVRINDEPIEGAAELLVGDRLSIGSHEVLLVSMAD